MPEYAFEMAASSIRFGPGCTKEVGMDFKNMGSKRVMVVTDPTVRKLDAMKQVVEGLEREGVTYEIFDKVRVEPKDHSIKEAIEFAKPWRPDAYLAVGGGSVIDTAKLMNLYTTFPEADFLDFVNAPLGKGLPIPSKLFPLIAVPTTAGTGSETTGTAIFDLVSKRAKTGIAHRNLKPTLGIVDPLNTHPEDHEAQSQMLLAATLAGVGFGNAGVHLCHGMSYPISGQNPGYKHAGYEVDHTIIPHGVSVAVTAPAVFKFTGASNPERHLAAAEAFGVDISNVKAESAGEVLSEALAEFLIKLGDQPRGLKALGFGKEHLDQLVEGTIPQARVLMLAPSLDMQNIDAEREQLRTLFEDAMEY
ncbi:ADH4-alcohol dehydrogenase IV [Pyrenophora seminiperda CCB06]|uniref:hydroxyacid-oxoacid transhydrogenase n=1 Tax=Pyrenophora seminiperda CCB06 TaxID=1302712 RepID=A0A3M7M1H1_9PLEO|nr:ADH4-alcohol dehydrogenase IV [Pyrenophora seminiperda CCB06]